jgi:hypothetical protein
MRDVLRSLLPAVLAAHRRYAPRNVAARRGCGRASAGYRWLWIGLFSRIDETACAAWLCPALMNSARDALEQPWILDIDASIKPRYGQYRHVARDAPPHRHTARL